jgi:putative transposase
LKKLEQEKSRYGSPRLCVLLRRGGYKINHKKTERLYKEKGLWPRLKRRKKRILVLREMMQKTKEQSPINAFADDALCQVPG